MRGKLKSIGIRFFSVNTEHTKKIFYRIWINFGFFLLYFSQQNIPVMICKIYMLLILKMLFFYLYSSKSRLFSTGMWWFRQKIAFYHHCYRLIKNCIVCFRVLFHFVQWRTNLFIFYCAENDNNLFCNPSIRFKFLLFFCLFVLFGK